MLRICLHVSNAEILGTAQRFATAAPIKECSNEPLKIITGVRTVVNFRAKSRKMGSCNPFSIHQGTLWLNSELTTNVFWVKYMIVISNYSVVGVSRRHFLKVRSTLVCGQFVVVLVQFRHFCFLVK